MAAEGPTIDTLVTEYVSKAKNCNAESQQAHRSFLVAQLPKVLKVLHNIEHCRNPTLLTNAYVVKETAEYHNEIFGTNWGHQLQLAEQGKQLWKATVLIKLTEAQGEDIFTGKEIEKEQQLYLDPQLIAWMEQFLGTNCLLLGNVNRKRVDLLGYSFFSRWAYLSLVERDGQVISSAAQFYMKVLKGLRQRQLRHHAAFIHGARNDVYEDPEQYCMYPHFKRI